jgi:TctA family transporter
MLPVTLTFIPFALLFVYLIPTARSRSAGVLYLAFLVFFIWGVGGFIFSGKPTANEMYVFYAFYIFILGIHTPLLIKMSQIKHKKEHLKSARNILGSDVKHLTDDELHYRLKH